MKYLLSASASLGLAACATTAGGGSGETWEVSRSVDPITSVERCVVAAPDRVGSFSFSRVGYLYPFVEMNSEAGLMVGVSSGGQVRMTPGDIQWRVDQQPHRTLAASNTPVFGEPSQMFDTSGMTEEMRTAMEASQSMTAGLMSSMQNGVTAADGDDASEIVAEMRAGSTLIFRSVGAAPAAGLTSASTYAVGQAGEDGIQPYPLDASFEAGLAACGIDEEGAA